MAAENTYGIAAALSEALEAAVFADSTAANKAYEMIEKYAYGQDITIDEETEELNEKGKLTMDRKKVTMGTTELAMAEFTIRGADGKLNTVSIPKITMMPLSLLHVKEATFGIEMTASIVNSSEEESTSLKAPESTPESTTTQTRAGRLTTVTYRRADGTVIRRVRPSSQQREEELKEKALAGMRPSSASVTNQQMAVSSKNTSSKKDASTVNMKVQIKMEQAELPEGIKLLLQAAANSLQVAAESLKEN